MRPDRRRVRFLSVATVGTTSSGSSRRTPRSTTSRGEGPPAVRREFVDVGDGRRVSALVWGDADPDLVLVHGGAQNAHTWDTVALALDRPLVAVDLPGHGHSDWREDRRYWPVDNAEDVATAMRALAPSPRLVVGMSLGGLTSVALAARHPELVPRLMLVDVTPGVDRDKAAPIAEFVAGPERFESFDEILARTVAFNPTRTESSLRRGILHNAREQRRRQLGVAVRPLATRRGRGHPGLPAALGRRVEARDAADAGAGGGLRRCGRRGRRRAAPPSTRRPGRAGRGVRAQRAGRPSGRARPPDRELPRRVNPRREASERVDGAYEVRVLEPSPPPVTDGPWFADDPATRGDHPPARRSCRR